MSSKTYVMVETKPLYGIDRYFIKSKHTIKCLGGENMNEEKSELVFIDNAKVPKALKGKTGRDWNALFEQIPKGKTLIVPESYGTGATVRDAVKNVNKALGKAVYKAFQRTTANDKVIIYVQRL